MKPSIGAKSDVGRVREGNEDSYLIHEPFFAVADGMGGHLAGDVASRTAVETISEYTQKGPSIGPEGLERAVKEANGAIYEKASSDPALHGMGTTCTLLLVDGSEMHIAHVGDSRAYLLRSGEFSQLTEDHTLVGRMVKEGRLQPEEAERHPQRSIITRALGVDGEVEVDLQTVPIHKGDKVLVCSDGLTSMIDSDSIRRVLTDAADPQSAVEELVELANEAGGEDNITAVVLAFEGDESGAVARPVEDEARTEELAAAAAGRQETAAPVGREEGVTGAARGPKEEAPPASKIKARPVLATLMLIVLVVTIGALVFKYVVLDNSYYVAATDDGRLAIFQGLPDEILGVTFQEEVETSATTLAELPPFLMEDVKDGIEVDSFEDAEATLANLEERARDKEFEKSRDANKTGGNK